MSSSSRFVTLYLYSYFNKISTHFANAETLLRALEQVTEEKGTLYFKERTDEDCELILYADQGQITYTYQCQSERIESLKREQVLELIEEMYQGIHWDEDGWDEEDWFGDEEEDVENMDCNTGYLQARLPRYS